MPLMVIVRIPFHDIIWIECHGTHGSFIHSFIHDFITENIFCHFHPFRVIKERNGKGNYFFLYSICFVRFEITLYLLCHMLVVK